MVVELARSMMESALWLVLPLLAIVTAVSLLINVVQVLTSLQETTLSTVPRLAVVVVAALLMMPWMIRHMANYTVRMLSDFRPFLR